MSYAESINPGPGFGPPPWVQRGLRGHRRARMMMAAMNDGQAVESNDEGQHEASEGRSRRGHGHGRGPGFGPGPWGGRGPWGPPRGRRRERGDVRAAILLLLAEQPRHGYEILTELADRSDGQWQPSPGSIYPVLKRLAKEGLVTAAQEDGKRIFSLTDEGRAVVAAEKDGWGEPWLQREDPAAEASMELFAEGKQLGAAVWQVSQGNDPAQIEATKAILAEARKKIYGVLAE